MPHTATNRKKPQIKKSQEIVFKQPSIFRKVVSFITAYSMMFLNITPVLATNITGVEGNNGVYDIDATKISGSTGFRQYTDFTLDNGDVANLKFDQGYDKFVNLVDNQVNINGIVNTVKGDAFYNGHAIFVSPNGMVVGASGVLNVGSLTIAAPTSDKFDSFKNAYTGGNLKPYEYGAEKYDEVLSTANGDITVNGKIVAKGTVEMYGGNVTIEGGEAGRAAVIAGAKGQNKITAQEQAKQVFDALVSSNISNADTFNLENGKVKIVARKESLKGDAAGNINADINIKNADIGANKVDILAKAKVERQEKIDLAEAKIDIENTKITGDTVSIIAEATQKKKFDAANPLDDIEFITNTLTDIFGGNSPKVTSLWGVAGKADAQVNIDNSEITALKAQSDDGTDNSMADLSVYIHAEASSETTENANFLTPTIINFIKDDDAKIAEFFNSKVFSKFEGARSSAVVNVKNSAVNAIGENAKNIEISTEASSSLDANNRILAFILPVGLYGVGTETISKTIIEATTLNTTDGDIDINAISSNENAVNINNDSLFSVAIEDAQLWMILNNNVVTDTEASVIGNSDIDTDNVTVLATNLASSEAELGMKSKANKDGQGRGNSAVSAVAILNRSNNNVTAQIKDSKVKTKEDTAVIAQSLNITKNTADATVDDKCSEHKDTFDQKVKEKLDFVQKKYMSANLFDFIKGKTGMRPSENPTLEGGGVLVWNNTNNTVNAIIENSNVTAGDAKIQANTVDLTANGATSDASGEGSFGIGLAVIVNQQTNITNANIKGSSVTADNVITEATTELPMNQGQLTFGLTLPFKIAGVEKLQLGGGFASEANGKWDVSFIKPEPQKEEGESNFEITGLAEQNVKDVYEDLKPKFRMEGFFNNFAHSEAKGSNASISGSVVYNEILNNTTASVTDGSQITVNDDGKLIVNAVNTVLGYNAAGLIEFLVNQINYQIPGQEDEEYTPTMEAGTFGLGVNLLWDNYTNNATAEIDNSAVDAAEGRVDITSANEQAYITATMTGAKSEKFGIDGSVNVQNIKGDTLSVISNVKGDNSIKAKDVSVNAGNASVKTTGGVIKRDEETNLAVWKIQDKHAGDEDKKYTRKANDTISNIILQGAWIAQNTEVDNTVQTNSGGVAVGASVNVTDIDRNVKATVSNSNIETANDLNVNAYTYGQKIDVEVAAAFAGGVTQKAAEVKDVQKAADDAQDDENDSIFGNLFDNEDEYMKNPVGNALSELQGQFNMSIAGAVDVVNDKTNVEASITGDSTLDIGNELTIDAMREAKNIAFSGGLGKSKKVGAGAAINVYKQDGSVKSFIDGSVAKFSGKSPKLKINADNKNWILDIAVGVGAVANNAKEGNGFQSAVGGSASVNTLKPTVEAYINNSTISRAEGASGYIDTTLTAKSDVDIIDIASGGSYMHGGSSGLSAGAALNYNNIKNTINTYVKDSALHNMENLILLSDADNNLNGFAIASSLVTGTDGFSFAFDGAVDIDYVHDTITSKIINSTIGANNNVELFAKSNSDNLAVAGTFDITTAQTGAGVNGDVVINVYRNDITSEIEGNSKILKAQDVKVVADSFEKSNVIPVGLSVATGSQYLMAAANVGVNVIDNSVKAYVSGNIGTDYKINNLVVLANDETTLYSRGGTLSVASADAVANIAGSVNIDIIDKTVEAKIQNADVKANKDVRAMATSINSLGGTKDGSGKYSREDVTKDSYKEKMLNKNSDGEYVGLKQSSDFKNWNMFYDFSVGAEVSVAGAAIVKSIGNTVTAEVSSSDIESNTLTVFAEDYSIKNIIAGALSASGTGSVGLQALVTKDHSTTSALIDGKSKLKIAKTLDMAAVNRKDNYQIMIAGGGAGTFSVNANVIVNDITDKAVAKIDNASTDTEIKAKNIAINANEDMNASHIIVTGSGAGSVAINVSPLINNYNGTTEAAIENAKIKDAAIDIDALSNIGTLDISVGVSGVGQGLAATGIAIKNNYTNTVKSYIGNALIDTYGNIDIDADSVINSNNWIASLGVAGQGANIIVNVLLNNVISTVEAGIKDSNITNSGAVNINTNKNKKDKIYNKAIGLGFAGEGASALANVVQNIYKNIVKSYVDNTSSVNIYSLNINSNSERKLDNVNIGASAAAVGASLLANALVNQIDSTTTSYIDAQDKTINISYDLGVLAKDTTQAINSMGMINAAGLGAAAGANINLYYADNLAKSEVKSSSGGQINAGSANINSDLINALDNSNISVTLGMGAIAGDVALIKIGKRTATHSQAEQKSGIKTSIDYTQNKYDQITANDADNVKNLYTQVSSSSELKTGSVASVDGNLKTSNNISVNAQSKLKGIGDKEILKLTNTNVTAGLATVGVGVKDIQFASNTTAEIIGGNVESRNKNVTLNANSKANVEIENVKVDVSGLRVSGGSEIYNNTSETLAQVKDASVRGTNIGINAKSENKSSLDSTNVVVTGGGIVSVDLAETTDTNKSVALITGNTNINALGKLTLHSTTNTDLSSVKSTVTVAGANLVDISKNEATANTINRAIIENVNGTIKTGGLDIITDYDKMSVFSKANVTSVKLGDVASVDSSGAFMNADFKSGIDSPNLTLINLGITNIETAKDNVGNGIVAKSEINNVHVSLQGFVASTSAKAENNAVSSTVMKTGDHKAKRLTVNSNLKSVTTANAGATKATVGIGVNAVSVDANDTSTLNMDIAGQNTFEQDATITAKHNAEVNSDLSAYNFSGIGGGQRIRLSSKLRGDTNGTIGGYFSTKELNIDFSTTRNSVLSKSSGGGALLVNVDDTKTTSHLNGVSVLNISALKTDKTANNQLTVNNVSDNTMDIISSDKSGAGLLAVSSNNTDTEFNTSATTNVNNTNVHSKSDVAFNVKNNSIIKDTSKSTTGGTFITIADTTADNTYDSSAKLSLNKTVIDAENIKLKASSDIRTGNDGFVDYVGDAKGLIAKQNLELSNTIKQTSGIEIVNTLLDASKDIVLGTLTSSLFKQRTNSDAGGFVAIPRSKNWLTVTNNNKITIDSSSDILANDELEIDFDSDNTLEARANSSASHVGFKDPVAESYLTLTINNTLQNSGSIEAGNLVDINYMSDSMNNLTQYAHSEADGLIPTTTENGRLSRTINNKLINAANADITSGKDVNMNFTEGRFRENSEVSYQYTTYALFGIPISHSNSWANLSRSHNKNLNNDGKIAANQGNSKYMKINSDGTIDESSLRGFYDDEYTVNDTKKQDGKSIKNKNLAELDYEMDNLNETLGEIDQSTDELTTERDAIQKKRELTQEKLAEIDGTAANNKPQPQSNTRVLMRKGIGLFQNSKAKESNLNYELKTEAEIATMVQEDVKAAVVGTEAKQIDEDTFNAIIIDYNAQIAEIEDYNNKHPEDAKDLVSITQFIADNDYGLDDAQKANITSVYENVNDNFTTTDKGGFTVYKNQYVLVTNPTEGETCDEIELLKNELASLDKQIEEYNAKLKINDLNKEYLSAQKEELQEDISEVHNTPAEEYQPENDGLNSVIFNDIDQETGNINIVISGAENIDGSGTFSVYAPGIQIDNYSPRDLIFNDIDTDFYDEYGLIIDGVRQSTPVDQDIVGVTINDYYHNNPVDPNSLVNVTVTDNFDTEKTVNQMSEHNKSGIDYQNYNLVNQNDKGFTSDVKIIGINRYGAIVENDDNWQVGEEREIEFWVDNKKIKVKCVASKVVKNRAVINFVDMPASVANRIAYYYMKMAAK